MPLDNRDYIWGRHPAACTCVDCVEGRLGFATERNRRARERSGGASRWLLLVGAVVVAFVVGVLLAPSAGPTIDRLTERIEEALAPTPTATIVRGRSMAEPVVAVLVATPTPTAAVAPTPTAQAAASEPTPTPVPQVSLRSFTNGLWLEAEDPSLAASIKELDWVQDGIQGPETAVVQGLLDVAARDRSVASSVVALEWVQDGADDVEVGAIEWLGNIADTRVASAVVSLTWVRDGVDETEVKAIEDLSYVANRDADVALSIIALNWIEDGVDSVEVEAIDWMANMASAEVASSVVALDWVEDGVEDAEVRAIEELSYMTNVNAKEALRIVGMQFVETLEPPDVAALMSLRQLAAFRPDAFARVMRHEALGDGVTDDLAPVIATLNGVARTNPGLIDVLLDPSNVLLEQRNIRLPLSGEVVLAVIRTRPGAARSIDLLEHSVRSAEALMGAPLPTRYVGLLYEEAVAGSSAGTNFGTHIAIVPRYDVDDGSQEASFAGHSIAHEVAHYYWRDNADWVDEGAADIMASIVDNARTGRPVGITNRPCAYAGSIAELEALELSRSEAEFTCNYSLGERLFVDLYRTLGEAGFVRGFRELNRHEPAGIEHVRQSFGLTGDNGAASVAIARWYDGIGPFPFPATEPTDPSLPSIGGQIDFAYVSLGQYGSPASTLPPEQSTEWLYVVLQLSYKVSEARELPLKIVQYYQDGFAFEQRDVVLTVDDRHVGQWLWFPIGFAPSELWASGRYLVQVYMGERKIAEVEYEATS